MTRTKQHIQERMDELAVSYEEHARNLDFPQADIAMEKILELTDVLVILEAELDGFKPKNQPLEIGEVYYFDSSLIEFGKYVGVKDKCFCFEPTLVTQYKISEDGFVKFIESKTNNFIKK